VTRFYVVSYSKDVSVPWTTPPPRQERALIRVSPANNPGTWNISRAVTAVNMPISRIDRRPSLCSKTFCDVYFLEVYAQSGENVVSWFDCVTGAVERLGQDGLESAILGIW